MKAITVRPGDPKTLALEERPMPEAKDALLVEVMAVGICGTDRAIIERGHGEPPPGSDRLLLGHESVGRVVEAPAGSGFESDDLVVGIVRRPDPEPCECCAIDRWDMCLNGGYREHGIKALDGYASEFFTLEPNFAIRVPVALGTLAVLVEPTSIVTKAWRRIEGVASINCLDIEKVLVTGAGPIGLLAALLAKQAGLDVQVLDRVASGAKPRLVAALGATYRTSLDECAATDAVLECTGAPSLISDVVAGTRRNSIVCLTGVSEREIHEVDLGALNRELVLENDVILGTVNAAAEDYVKATSHLANADRSWLENLITRRVPLDSWRDAYERRDGDVKTIIEF